MDYPKSVPNVGLVNGKFVDENTATGQVGSLIPAAWGSAVTDELLAVIQAGGLEPTEGDNDQLLQALQAIISAAIPSAPAQASESVAGIVKLVSDVLMTAGLDDTAAVTLKKLVGKLVSQGYTAFTTGGAAAAYTLTPVPALAGYAENQRFRVKFDRAGAGATTLNISGRGAKRLKQYDSAGNKVDAVLAAGQLADVEYDGAEMVILDPLPALVMPPASIQGSARALAVSATGTNAQVTVSADELVLKSASGGYQGFAGLALTINAAASGFNGLDTGALAASTWYSIWVIWNGATTAGLLSLSATAPTLPAGYTHKARVGWIRTDATANKYPLGFTQLGRSVQYKVAVGSNVSSIPVLSSGVAGNINTPAWVAVPTGAFVPSTAAAIKVMGSTTQAGLMVAPNNQFGAIGSTTNPPPYLASAGSSNAQSSSPGVLLLESSNIYLASSGSSAVIACLGWEDNL